MSITNSYPTLWQQTLALPPCPSMTLAYSCPASFVRYPERTNTQFDLDLPDEPSSYEWSRNSGALAFWDDPDEDIYTLEDGRPL